MNAGHQRTVARRIVKEVLEQQRPEVIPELFTPDFHSHDWGPQYAPGLAGIHQLIEFSKQAFVNVRTEMLLDPIVDGDMTVSFFSYHAEHVGDLWGQPSKGRSFTERIVHILRFEDGKVAEHWRVQNDLGMLKQLGVWPEGFMFRNLAVDRDDPAGTR
jgi:predicted ester cyclase